MSTSICNESHKNGAKVLDPIRVSLRDPALDVPLTSIQMDVGYAKLYATGTDTFDHLLPRTRLSSVLQTSGFSSDPSITVSAPNVTITKTSAGVQPSVYVTSYDLGKSSIRPSAMVTAVIHATVNPAFTFGDPDPVGPVVALEYGPRQTAVYVFIVNDPIAGPSLRICGPSINGVRTPDTSVVFDWTASPIQYIIHWCEERGEVLVYSDNSDGTTIATPTLQASIPISSFPNFGFGSIQLGGNNDISVIYGVEGKNLNSAYISSVALATDVGSPFINGGVSGGWKTFLDTDLTCGFSGTVDPTRLRRGGAWFLVPGGDPAGTIVPSPGGYSRFLKKTTATGFSIYRDEPGFLRSVSDGFMVEFKVNADLSGIAGYATGAALKISDGQTLFQLDFLFNGSTYNVGLLKNGGDPNKPGDHLVASSPVNWVLKTMRLTVDPRRGVMDLYDVADLVTPLASWAFNRASLPAAATTQIEIGLPGAVAAVGAFDIYALRYTYIYQAWEARDGISPIHANPVFKGDATIASGGPLSEAVMPGVDPLPYSGGGASGTAAFTSDGYQISCGGGQTLLFHRQVGQVLLDETRGGACESRLRVTQWHSDTRTGCFLILDTGTKAYMLSFVDTPGGKYICVPIAAGVGQFQEWAGPVGLGAALSYRIDWTQAHVYRLERRPRDGVYVFVDNVPVLVIPDTARFVYPDSQFPADQGMVGFGVITDEGSESIWDFARYYFGSGFEISTVPTSKSEAELRNRLHGARTTVVVSAGV